tara:strand:+ start:447 stop:1133 length:687 start_codon:yes stop_codon:yes gene_type:complete
MSALPIMISTENQGIGSIFDEEFIDRVRASASPSPVSEELYGKEPTFFEKLEALGYKGNRMDVEGFPEKQQLVMVQGDEGRPDEAPYLPTLEELQDTRQHLIGGALASKEGGILGTGLIQGKEVVDFFKDIFTDRMEKGTAKDAFEDSMMDMRNNAVGRKLFKKAGLNVTTGELIIDADNVIIEQIKRLMGNPPKNKTVNRQVESGQPQLYFPTKEDGSFAIRRSPNN